MAPTYGLVDDLASLSDLDEQIILKELKERYDRNIIYTYIGDILVAVNPYKKIQGYGDQVGHEYGAIRELSEKPPHVYAMATYCYQSVRRNNVNQCLLVSGESGAGKTETSKLLVAQVVRISNTSGLHDLHEKIIEVNLLLEAFGNAQTVMNSNSSRFGKLIEIMLSQAGEITGAKVTEHMLEKTRVVRKNQGERSFHIFYCMLAGMSGHEKRRFYVDRPPEYYRIVDPGYGNPVYFNGSDFQDNESMLHDLNRIMEDVGFDRQEVDMIFGLVAGILHLCNIEFAEDPEMGHVIIMNEEAIDYASALLSLQAEDLATVLLSNRSFVRGERIVAMKTVLQAVDGRDALAKTLYSRLFSWIVQQINTILDPHAYGGDNRQSVISILDMAGFENFPVNSLEQLCINTANEQLQNFFNEYIFTMELKEYQGEGIKSPKIKFTNNREILDMLLRRPTGIYAILEDECRLQTTTDMSFVEKLNHTFSKHEFYKKSKSRDPVFTIYHYAGHVTYRAEGFLDKNRDTMSPNLYSLMENSSSPLIAQLFGAASQMADPYRNPSGRERNHWDVPDWSLPARPGYSPGDSMSRQVGRKIKQRLAQEEMRTPRGGAPVQSSSGHFRSSLGDLVEKLNSSEPHFIRCLKPNANQKPMSFDPKLIINQLLSTGVLETTKIRKLGYPTRLPFHVFVDRYKFVAFSLTQHVEPDYYACLHILQAAGVTDCEIGKTKVFLRYWQVDRLNLCLDEMLKDLVIVQNVIKMYLCRRRFLHLRREHYKHQDMIGSFGDFVAHEGDKAYHMMISSRDHDERNYRSELEKQRKAREHMYHRNQPSRHRGLRRYNADDMEMRSRFSSRNQPHIYNSPREDYSPQQRAGAGYYNSDSDMARYSSGYIIQNVLNQVMQKLPDIDRDAWCKIHYMECDRTVAKCYILDREVIIDGSYEEFDGERIGLGVFRNPTRDNKTEHIRQYIGKGLKLRKDEDGSIFATRLGSYDAIVKDHTRPREHCFSEDVITHNGLLPFNEGIKVFDMEEFKSHMGLQLKFKQFDEQLLESFSVVGISFIEDHEELQFTPCWLLVVNLIALRNISDPNIKNQVQQKIAELSIRDEEKVEEDIRKKIAGQRHNERRWSKVNPRQGVQGKDAPLRKTRLELRSKGEKINKHMVYSWDEQNYGSKKQLNLAEIQEEYEDPESMMGGPRSPSSVMQRHYSNGREFHFNDRRVRQNWAKLKVYMKEEEREIEERDFKAKQENFS